MSSRSLPAAERDICLKARSGLAIYFAEPRHSDDCEFRKRPLMTGRDSARSNFERQLFLSSSRNAMASSSTRTASITGTTGRASNTKAGNIEQNL